MNRHLSNSGRNVLSRITLALFTATLLTIGLSFPAGAEELMKPGPRQGYYFGASGLAGIGGVYTQKTNWVAPMGGPLGALHIGQGLNEQLAIGLHLGAGVLYSDGRKSVVGNISIELKWSFYKNLFIRPSIGFGFADVSRTEDNLKKILSDVGGTYHVAVGYDFFPFHKKGRSGGVGVTPIAWINAMNGTNLTYLAGGIGIEFTFHVGLPKNQLDLPEGSAYR